MGEALKSILTAIAPGIVNAVTNNIVQKQAVDAQNRYNTPAAQMARYQAAGLSPNLIYGTGSASAGNQASLGEYQGTKISTSDAVNTANAILSLKNLDANWRKANAEAATAEATAENTRLDTEEKRTFLSQYQTSLNLDLELKRLQASYRRGEIGLQTYQRMAQLAQIRHLNTQSAINDWQLKEGLPTTLAISQQNANTAEQNMILGFKRFAFDSSFDQALNPLNFWNVNQRERDYHWTPVNNVSRIAMPLISGGLLGTVFRMGKGGLKKSGSGGSRGPTEHYYNSRNYQSAPDYGFYD